MTSLLVLLCSGAAFALAYHTYARYLSRRVFRLDRNAQVPSHELDDNVDYVPTRRSVVFGHHFSSIAGTGPIVGPAIAVFWGWLPALLWVVFGAIFVGAVHDLGTLIVSVRTRGQSIGDAAGRYVSPRARALVLLIMFFTLALFIAILGLVIAVILTAYPSTVIALWISMPLAVFVGFRAHRAGSSLFVPVLASLILIYGSLYIGVFHLPIDLTKLLGIPLLAGADVGYFAGLKSVVVIWTAVLFVYCFAASVLPVWLLLQPRDYINSLQLIVALAVLALGVIVARPEVVAPAINFEPPADAPSLLPFLFITVACGAVSGFHSIVSTGTSSKQLDNEEDAKAVGYGGMLLEGVLSVLVILACVAGLGLGVPLKEGGELTGLAAWKSFYGGAWGDMVLARQIAAFVEGGGNLIAALGFPLPFAVGVVGLIVASFAATSIDTSTRLQRYVLQELGAMTGVRLLRNKYVATTAAVVTAAVLAFISGPKGPGSGGLILWPLFGITNQLLAGMGFLVIAFYLVRHRRPIWFLTLPLAFMVVMPAWAMIRTLHTWYLAGNWLLFGIGLVIEALQVWMVAEGLLMWKSAAGVLPEAQRD